LVASLPFLIAATPPARNDTAPNPPRVAHPASGTDLVLIPAGEFNMGSPEMEADRGKGERLHRRVIRRPFYLGRTEVTVGQFRKFVEATAYKTDAERDTPENGRAGPGAFATIEDGEREWSAAANWRNPFPNLKDYQIRDDHPVVQVTWHDAQKFVAHYGLRLPSEAEWEYAARAGSRDRYPWGPDEAGGKGFANVGDEARRRRFVSTNVFFPFDDGAAMLSSVATYKPNAWGLYDMIGNVEEWCQDAVGRYPPDGADESPAAGAADAARVLRGGAWVGNAGTSRSATRIGMRPSSRRDFQGFRVAVDVDRVR
jgi:formylglycine-generating enzyme required for sulfatase activity